MSADCWRLCPRCLRSKEAELNAAYKRARQAADEAYGQVDQRQFIDLAQNADELQTTDARKELAETLREDYECWTGERGTLYVHYRCQCTGCGFKHTFKHEENLLEAADG